MTEESPASFRSWARRCIAGFLMVATIVGVAAVVVKPFIWTSAPAPDDLELALSDMALAVDGTDEVQPLHPLSVGPHGEVPVGADVLARLLDEEVAARVRAGNFAAIVCMQDLAIDNDWAQLQLQGIKVVFDHLGVRILAVTNGEFDLEKQAADYRNAIALAPDVIITIPLDAERMAPVLRAAVDRGIRLVFIDNVPTSFVHPRDYVGMVMADSYANGVASASVLIDSLRPRDEVILLHWQNRMFTTDERSRAANDTFAAHPEVKVAAQAYFSDVFEAETLTAQLLQAHPAVRGVWVVWDTPALEAHKAAHDLSREVAFATIDLGREVGARLAAHDEFVGVGAQHPFQQGVAEAMLAVAALAGIPTPPFVLVPGEKVTRQSLPRAWERVFREPFPNELGMGAKHPPAPKVATP